LLNQSGQHLHPAPYVRLSIKHRPHSGNRMSALGQLLR
jgi:hypothetical protein